MNPPPAKHYLLVFPYNYCVYSCSIHSRGLRLIVNEPTIHILTRFEASAMRWTMKKQLWLLVTYTCNLRREPKNKQPGQGFSNAIYVSRHVSWLTHAAAKRKRTRRKHNIVWSNHKKLEYTVTLLQTMSYIWASAHASKNGTHLDSMSAHCKWKWH